MGRAGRQRLADEFDPQLHLHRLESIYRGEASVGRDEGTGREPGHVDAQTLEGAS
jgi:hypothetical protein